MMDFAKSRVQTDIFMENGNILQHFRMCSYTSFKLRLIIHYLMECDLGHLSDVVLSLVTLQDLCLDGVGEACRKVKLTGWSN